MTAAPIHVLRAPIEVTGPIGAGLVATTRIVLAADEAVFAGHYPGMPILPGVCLLECALRAARECAPRGDDNPALRAVEQVRFRYAAFPGDAVEIRTVWREDGPDWRCTATLSAKDTTLATVRLRYARQRSST